jgi:hypothetical protein
MNRPIVHPPGDMSMERLDGMILTGKPKNLEKSLSERYFFHYKFHMD